MQEALVGAAALNVEPPGAIASDGSGEATGIPGGACTGPNCVRSVWAQVGYLATAVVGAVVGGGKADDVVRAAKELGQAVADKTSEAWQAAKAAAGGAPKQLPSRAGPAGYISPSEVSGMTPAQIDARARALGLEPRGPAPMQGKGAYVDPQTGQQRILVHPGSESPHGHVNNQSGARIGPTGQVVPQESAEAHLPIKVP